MLTASIYTDTRQKLQNEMKRCNLSLFVMSLQLGEPIFNIERYLNGNTVSPYFERKVEEWLE